MTLNSGQELEARSYMRQRQFEAHKKCGLLTHTEEFCRGSITLSLRCAEIVSEDTSLSTPKLKSMLCNGKSLGEHIFGLDIGPDGQLKKSTTRLTKLRLSAPIFIPLQTSVLKLGPA